MRGTSFPGCLSFLVVVLVLEQSLETLIIVLAIVSWPGAVRLVRAETLSLKNREYVSLARVAGASNARIMVRHILPGVREYRDRDGDAGNR